MERHPLVYQEWPDDHGLSRRSLMWIESPADPGDPHAVPTAIDQFRRGRADRLTP
jgi:hypothetical protein